MQLNTQPLRLSVAAMVSVLSLVPTALTTTASSSSILSPGAVFTETNQPFGNFVLAFQRTAQGTLTLVQSVPTGGIGSPVNPPLGIPDLDSEGAVQLASDGDNKACLFAVNAGSNTVSSFAVNPKGLSLADQEPTGNHPISLTSNQIGPNRLVLYVLNSSAGSSSIEGYYVSGSCTLTPIPGSFRATTSPESLPAHIAFNQHGQVLTVSERITASGGDLDVFPVDSNGVVGAPMAQPSAGQEPYGMAWNNADILAVANQGGADPAGSTITTYQLTNDDTLVPLSTAPSPGAACCDVFTDNGSFLYVTNPLAQESGGSSVTAYAVSPDGTLTLVDTQTTTYNAVQDAVSHDSKYLYVLSDQVIPPGPAAEITAYSIDREAGTLTQIQELQLSGNSFSGLAAW